MRCRQGSPRAYLVCNGYAALDVKKTIDVTTINSVGNVEFLNPFRAYSAQSFFILRISLDMTGLVNLVEKRSKY